MRRAGIALLLALALSCSSDDAEPFEALGADESAVSDYEVEVDERQTDERRWVRIVVERHGDGVAEAVAADYLTTNPPDTTETVVNVTFEDEPALSCAVVWPDDDRNTGCP